MFVLQIEIVHWCVHIKKVMLQNVSVYADVKKLVMLLLVVLLPIQPSLDSQVALV